MTPVSAIITCYNLEWSIGEAIESVLAQTETEALAEIIVVDDGSRDDSREVIKRYADQHPRVRAIFKPNGGASSARNAGIAAAKHRILAFLDGDDLWTADKLARQLPYLERQPRVGLFVGDYLVERRRGEAGQHVPVADFSEDGDALKLIFLKGGPILPSTSLIRAEVFARVGGFDETQRLLNDEEMWQRIAHAYPIQRTPFVVAAKREHEENLSSNVLGRVEALRGLTDKVLALRPDLASSMPARRARIAVMAGKALMGAGRVSEARREFRRAWAAQPASAKAALFTLASHVSRDPDQLIERGKRAIARLRPSPGAS